MDGHDCSIFELDQDHPGVFEFHRSWMIKIFRYRVYANDISHHPIEQIDEVTELCVQSSAVQSFLAFPIGLYVVPVVSIPEAIQLHAQYSAELPFIDGFLHRLNGGIETVLLDDEQLFSRLF